MRDYSTLIFLLGLALILTAALAYGQFVNRHEQPAPQSETVVTLQLSQNNSTQIWQLRGQYAGCAQQALTRQGHLQDTRSTPVYTVNLRNWQVTPVGAVRASRSDCPQTIPAWHLH